MTIIKCDRCGKERAVEENYYGLSLYVPGIGQLNGDLCEACGAQLKAYIWPDEASEGSEN